MNEVATRSSAPPIRSGSPPTRTGLLLAVILIVAAILRVREAMRTRLWFDEIFTLWVARHDLPGILRAASQDVHPPLHFLLVGGWRALGGEGDLWLKLGSVVIGVATVAIAYPFARDLSGARTALVATALLALHPAHVFFSQEVRYFALLWLEILVMAWGAWRWIEHRRARDAVLFVTGAAAGLYTHYLAGLLLAFLAVWGAVVLRREPRRIAAWIGLHAAVGILFLPQLPTFLRQMSVNREHWIDAPAGGELIDLLRQLSGGAIYLVVPALALALLALSRSRRRRAVGLLSTIVFVPPLLTWVLTRQGAHLFTVRYMLFIVPFWCALLAVGLATLPWPRVRALATVAALALLLRATIIRPPLAEPVNLARVERVLETNARPEDLVLAADTHTLFYLRQHLDVPDRVRILLTSPHLPYYEGARLVPDDWRLMPDDFARLNARGARWWGVRTEHGGLPSTAVAALFDSSACCPPQRFGPVTVWEGRRDGSPPPRGSDR